MVRILSDTVTGSIDPALDIGHANWDQPEHLAMAQLHMHRLFPTVALETAPPVSELAASQHRLDIEALSFPDPLHADRRMSGEQFLNRRLYNDALLVLHDGAIVHESYRNGMRASDRHVLHSCTKSLLSMLVAIAAEEGRLQPEQAISQYVQELKAIPAWQDVSVQHLLDMQAGIEYSEDYSDPQAHYWQYARAAGYYPPLTGEQAIGIKAWILQNLTVRCATPGTVFAYNSCLSNILGIALEKIYGCGLAELFESKLYQRIGAEADGYFNTDRFGFPITEGQLSLRLRDFARLAMLVSNKGKNATGEQVLPENFAQKFARPDSRAQNAYQAQERDRVFPHGQYQDQFWVLDPAQGQFAMLGIHGQFAWYDLHRQLMICGFGSYPQQDGELMMRVLRDLWHSIADKVSSV